MVPPPEIINAPSGTSWQALPAPASVLPKDLVMTELRPLTWQGEAYWMVGGADGTRQYFRAHDGQLSDIEPALMTALARHFTGISSGDPELQLITSFSAEYPFINRYLPVWRVQFNGHDTVAFIEPRGLRLSALSDPWKTWFSATFSRLHSWSFWSHEPSRDIAMAIVLSLGLAVVVTGIFRLFRRKTVVGSKALNSSNPTELSAPHAARRWHRRLGWFVALGAIASMSSGMFHVLAINKSQPSFNAKPERVAFSAGQLRTLPPVLGVMGERSLAVASANGPLWMSYAVDRGHGAKSQHSGHDKEHAEHQHHAATPNLAISLQRAENAQPVAIERYVQELAAGVLAQHLGASIESQQAVTGFTAEYGFVQKRLPVYQLQLDTPDHIAIYIDPIDAVVSSVVTDLARVEGYSFAYIHKAMWLDGLGKDARDGILGLQALGVFVMACLGLLLARRRRLG
tara:strand:- start:1512 stop:2882 length:1371 start_codon:yes stop_codon:yes gene_type:complete